MASSIWHRLALPLVLQQVAAFPTFGSSSGAMKIRPSLGARDDGDWYEVADLSFITKMVAIGDSYFAGIGSGNLPGSYFSDPTASGC